MRQLAHNIAHLMNGFIKKCLLNFFSSAKLNILWFSYVLITKVFHFLTDMIFELKISKDAGGNWKGLYHWSTFENVLQI